MALYTIGDTHLSLSCDKPMDVFGGAWNGYLEKLTQGFSALTAQDTLVICGDLSWAMNLEDALADFKFLDQVKANKIILKGNHDYWWDTAKKMQTFWQQHELSGFSLLHNNCHFYADFALCGTRGWFYEQDRGEQSAKVFARELIRLEASLKLAQGREIICFFHYPPIYTGYRCQEILDLLHKYHVKRCFYGHLHGAGIKNAVQNMHEGIDFRLISADYLGFKPYKIM